MAKGEINLLYTEIDKLLNDICKFLSEELHGGFISQNGRTLATTLIERSKQQLHIITKSINADSSESILESYVDMQSYKVIPEQDTIDHQEVYSDVSLTYEEGISIPSIIEDDRSVCPYANLPATEIKEGRMGDLYRKEKILFFEQQKKIFGAIVQTWMLIYMNAYALKPCQIFDLTRYQARPSSVTLKDMKKRDECFELFSHNDSKLYQFMALTSKDMVQWVAAINKHYDLIITKRSLPPVPTPLDKRISTESANDYEPLKEYRLNDNENSNQFKETITRKINIKKPLPLPPISTPAKEIQQYIPRMPSEESLSSNYDSVGPGLSTYSHNNSNSFSDDDSDQHYDNPTELRQRQNNITVIKNFNQTINGVNNHNQIVDDDDEDNQLYDYLEKPKVPNIKFPITQKFPDLNKRNEIKPKAIKRPKILSLRHRKKSET